MYHLVKSLLTLPKYSLRILAPVSPPFRAIHGIKFCRFEQFPDQSYMRAKFGQGPTAVSRKKCNLNNTSTDRQRDAATLMVD